MMSWNATMGMWLEFGFGQKKIVLNPLGTKFGIGMAVKVVAKKATHMRERE